jgi:chromosome segregation ATPase
MPKTQEIVDRIENAAQLAGHGYSFTRGVYSTSNVCSVIQSLQRLVDDIKRDGIEDFSESVEQAAGLAAQEEAERLRQELSMSRATVARLGATAERLTAERSAARVESKYWQDEAHRENAEMNAERKRHGVTRGALEDVISERDAARGEAKQLGKQLGMMVDENESLRKRLAETPGAFASAVVKDAFPVYSTCEPFELKRCDLADMLNLPDRARVSIQINIPPVEQSDNG